MASSQDRATGGATLQSREALFACSPLPPTRSEQQLFDYESRAVERCKRYDMRGARVDSAQPRPRSSAAKRAQSCLIAWACISSSSSSAVCVLWPVTSVTPKKKTATEGRERERREVTWQRRAFQTVQRAHILSSTRRCSHSPSHSHHQLASWQTEC